MKETLVIKNFGPIKSVSLELGRFTVLIGEQATGKSTVAKVLAVCRYFSYIVDNYYNILSSEFAIGLESWGLKESIKDDTYIYYKCKHYVLTISRIIRKWKNLNTDEISDEFIFNVSIEPSTTDFNNLLTELNAIKPINSNKLSNEVIDWKIPYSFFMNDVKKVMDNPFYLPAQRGLQSIFSIGKSSINNLSDALFNQLARMDQIARFFKTETFIEPLNIYYVNRDGHGFIRKANEKEYYSLFNAASGYQSTIPIVLVIKYYAELRKRKKTFIFEEPEQNLFPSAQKKLIEYIVEKVNLNGSSVFISTQSPYILTSLNNMMYAYQVGEKNGEKVNGILDKKYWINPSEVSAYLMKADGTVENIIDNEGIMKAEKIDEVSTQLNTDFNKIINVEIGIDEELK